jgi:hypothetical protein
MSRKAVWVLVLVIAATVISCGVSKEDLQTQVKSSMQGKFDSDSTYKDYKLTVDSVTLIESGSRAYDGIAKVLYKGKAHDVQITVKTDKDNLMWSTQPLAFSFLME